MNAALYISSMLTAIAIMAGLCSCRDEGIDGPVDMTCTDIVTFAGNNDGKATFVFNKADDSPEITLSAQGAIDSQTAEAGSRMLIRYIPEGNAAYTSGPITLLGYAQVTQSSIVLQWRQEYDAWDTDKVYLYSAWRTGRYLNMHVRLTYSLDPRIFCIAADPSTVDTPWPDVYLVHIMAQETDYHDRAYYASFDLEPLWSRPDVEGIKLHIANSNLDKQIFTFQKSL